jgi:hypothetical protein
MQWQGVSGPVMLLGGKSSTIRIKLLMKSTGGVYDPYQTAYKAYESDYDKYVRLLGRGTKAF